MEVVSEVVIKGGEFGIMKGKEGTRGQRPSHRIRAMGRDTKPETVPDTCQRRSQVV